MKKVMLWAAFIGIATSSMLAQTSAPVTAPAKPAQVSKPQAAPATAPAETAKPKAAPKAAPAPTAAKPAKPAKSHKSEKPAETHTQTTAPKTQAPVVK